MEEDFYNTQENKIEDTGSTDIRALFQTGESEEDGEVYYEKPARQKREHRSSKIGKTILTGLLVILLGGSSGFGGAYLYNRLNPAKTGSNVIYQSVSTGTSVSKPAEDTLENLVENVEDSVVQISTESVITGGFFGNYVQSGAGSGVILTADGYIVTNHHVIDNATKITVILNNNQSYDATLIGSDETNDLAVLKINETGLKPAVMGDSDTLAAGQSVAVIGNPLGTLGGSVTSGVVSAVNRNVTVERVKMTLIQIDAAVNPGNSGGALFNMNGDLVGIVNAKYTSEDVEGIGFAIPINQAKSVIEQLINQGYVGGKVLLGITIRNINTESLAFRYNVDELGVYIVEVKNGSDAEIAGLKVGDRIIEVDGTLITDNEQISPIIQSHAVGDEIDIIIKRNGEAMTIHVTLTEQGNKK